MAHRATHMPLNDNCANRACHRCIQQRLGGPAALLLRQGCGLSEGAKREWSLIIPETMILIHCTEKLAFHWRVIQLRAGIEITYPLYHWNKSSGSVLLAWNKALSSPKWCIWECLPLFLELLCIRGMVPRGPGTDHSWHACSHLAMHCPVTDNATAKQIPGGWKGRRRGAQTAEETTPCRRYLGKLLKTISCSRHHVDTTAESNPYKWNAMAEWHQGTRSLIMESK